ncbi:MAG TPA: hypothetical protein PL182_00890 [Pseudobdellovibrionaceae bacterium]|nr:hypothetical protein [Pseudobdellovibrionaceae bacterium]
MTTDRLYDLFQMMLQQVENLDETDAQLITRVASRYALEIQQDAEIPGAFVEDVLVDLESEVLVMYRKTTYGYWSLRDYREARLIGAKTEAG